MPSAKPLSINNYNDLNIINGIRGRKEIDKNIMVIS
jgi:hypothetical protein